MNRNYNLIILITIMTMKWLLWTDIETTGLDVDHCKILQIACILTNMDMSLKFVFPETNIKCEESSLENMDEWCKIHHGESGLVEKVRHSHISLEDAENSIIGFLNYHVTVNDTIYIAGNSVHFDKKFIDKYMPRLSNRLRYRILDVSSIALLFDHVFQDAARDKPAKKYNHTAELDIIESVDEYDFYKTYLMLLKESKNN